MDAGGSSPDGGGGINGLAGAPGDFADGGSGGRDEGRPTGEGGGAGWADGADGEACGETEPGAVGVVESGVGEVFCAGEGGGADSVGMGEVVAFVAGFLPNSLRKKLMGSGNGWSAGRQGLEVAGEVGVNQGKTRRIEA